MKKLLTIAVAVSALALAVPAHAATTSADTETKVEQKDDGSYKAETKHIENWRKVRGGFSSQGKTCWFLKGIKT